jgi:ADP-ribosylglycohydrolase
MFLCAMNNPATTTVTDRSDPYAEPTLADRMRGAIWGQFVGDAFCLGSHWIYNLSELETAFPGGVQGFEEPRDGHYHAGKKPGDQTHYGEGALIMLESVAGLGHFDPTDFLRRFEAKFGSEEYRGYCDKATRGTLDNLRVWRDEHPGAPDLDAQNGADDDQLATASRLASVVAAQFRDPDLATVAERATRVCQNNERAVVYMQANALILRDLLAGRDLHSALHRTEEEIVRLDPRRGAEVRRKIAAGMAASLKPVQTAIVDEFGQSCPLASSFPSCIQAAVKHWDSFETAILHNARAGGDNAGRAAMLGAWIGAMLGIQGIPREWRDRLTARDRISDLVQRVTEAAAP